MAAKTASRKFSKKVFEYSPSSSIQALMIRIDWTSARVVRIEARQAFKLTFERVAICHGEYRVLSPQVETIQAGQVIYFAASDGRPGYYYPVLWNEYLGTWNCNCPRRHHGCHHATETNNFVVARKQARRLRKEQTEVVVPPMPLPALPEIITYISSTRRTVQRGRLELEPQYIGEDGEWHPWQASPGTTRTVRFHPESAEERAACEAFMFAPSDSARKAILDNVWNGRFAVLSAIDRQRAPQISRAAIIEERLSVAGLMK